MSQRNARGLFQLLPILINTFYQTTFPIHAKCHLSDDEREILDLRHGCKKWRRFYVQHNTNYPNDFSDGLNYTTLSHETAAAYVFPRGTFSSWNW